ncbi:MAG: preprotein translocase subunit SecE [Alphaproteobacteria bacterium]|jgi:preprotein translocase subunit SecE|nr:preprotein translocase subunit SecE [Alphaproteobacteria bacterium]MCV6599747.1 preprotein translocase subunit SecE [Alphaproteobacteria bacterium]
MAKSKKKKSIVSFFREVKIEASKITWISKKETVNTSIMVFIMLTFFAMFFFIIDQVLGFGIRLILGMGA